MRNDDGWRFVACRHIGYTSKATKHQINAILLRAIRKSPLKKVFMFRHIYHSQN